jgi:hypothetical protein
MQTNNEKQRHKNTVVQKTQIAPPEDRQVSLSAVSRTAISRSFYRYQPFGEPLLAVHFTAISRSPNR